MKFGKIFSFGIFMSLLFMLAATKVSAENAADCDLGQSKFHELDATQADYSIDDAQRIRNELGVRRYLLSGVVDCAIKEASSIQSGVDAVYGGDEDTSRLRSQFSSQMANAVNYYGNQKAKINDLGIQGSKDFARELKNWRAGNYELASMRASNFIIWAQNQELIKTAKDRSYQIGQAVGLLQIVDNEGIQNSWKDASANFNDTLSWNEKAKESLIAFGPPDESLDAIKASLNSLSETYKKFFDIISSINKALSRQT